MSFHFEVGQERDWVQLDAQPLGEDWLLVISNGAAHVGAVAVGEYDEPSKRASASVITLAGHRDDIVAKSFAQKLAGRLKSQRRVCVVGGIHIDDPTDDELKQLVRNADQLLQLLTDELRARGEIKGGI